MGVRKLAMIYMLLHYAFAASLLLWARLCWMSKILHTSWILLTFIAAALQGAGYYNHWLGRRYARALERQ